jgi:hypothetical protein
MSINDVYLVRVRDRKPVPATSSAGLHSFAGDGSLESPSIQNPPQYRLVGSTFLEFAQYRSLELGYGGIVGLHSLPGAEAFYDQAGFINCGADSEKEDLVYFECSAQEQDENSRDQVDLEQLDC